MPENGKLKLGLYWAASCGGCEIAVVELREKLLIVDQVADIVFWPCAMDFKYKDVEAMPDSTSTSACSTVPSAPARTSTWLI